MSHDITSCVKCQQLKFMNARYVREFGTRTWRITIARPTLDHACMIEGTQA